MKQYPKKSRRQQHVLPAIATKWLVEGILWQHLTIYKSSQQQDEAAIAKTLQGYRLSGQRSRIEQGSFQTNSHCLGSTITLNRLDSYIDTR